MLPSKGYSFQPATIHCPMDHLRMSFDRACNAYFCNLRGCLVAYSLETGYYLLPDAGDEYAREIFYAHAAICLCDSNERHPLYIQDYAVNRKVRFWACPVPGCDYEVSQRLEKTLDGWRMCGSFEHTKPVRIRRAT
jgi:hypothetical protein